MCCRPLSAALQRELDTLRAELNVAEKVPPELGHSGVIRGLSTEGHVPLTGTGSIEEVRNDS